MTTIQIKHRYTDAVLFECDVPAEHSGMAMRYALEKATEAKANLSYANLRGANLRGANLRGANLSDADLRGANLRGANLSDANLRGANLSYANLSYANLSGADLRGANLDGADLSYANLRGADLSYANLRGANLSYANLDGAALEGEILSQTPVSMTGLRWPILITDGFMRIGCQRHSHADWEGFNNDRISSMDYKALEFWSQWREPMLAMCKAHASTAKKEKTE